LSQKLDFTRMLASPTWHTRCMLYDDMTQLFQKKDDMTQRVMTSLYYKDRRQLKTSHLNRARLTSHAGPTRQIILEVDRVEGLLSGTDLRVP
jgi:hypothetical protein